MSHTLPKNTLDRTALSIWHYLGPAAMVMVLEFRYSVPLNGDGRPNADGNHMGGVNS